MPGTEDRKLLLSSVCKPFGKKYGDGDGVSYEGSHQLMWAQGIFQTRATTTQWGIDFIAENLRIPTTTLHYPSMKQFIRELKKGYDFVGIAFVVPTFHKMVPMVEAVRKYAPDTKIILGGYGTTMAEELEPYADYICQGEGVAYMRKLLGEPLDAPLVQPEVTQQQTLFSLPILGKVGYVFAGLGCPNGCDFCATSHYFKQKHIRLLPDGAAILKAIQDLRVKHPDMTDFWINDEDFLLNEERGREYLEAIRASKMPPLSISIFSSVKALSQFTAAELVEMGIDWIWVGFEGKRAGYSKMEGRPYPELFADLRAHGISLLASMIIGFDYQTPEIIQEEFEELVALRPSMSQFLIYGPARGTPGHKKLADEGRHLPEMKKAYNLHDGFYPAHSHPTMSSEQLVSIHRKLYHQEFDRLGPTVFRVAEDFLEGHVNLRDHQTPRVRAKAALYGSNAHTGMVLIPAARRYLKPHLVEWIDGLMDRLVRETGPMSAKQHMQAAVLPAVMRLDAIKRKTGFGQQPTFTRRSWRMGTPFQLQDLVFARR